MAYMGGKLLNQHTYLGIQIDHHLSWNPQVDYVCAKATRLISFLKRNLRHCSIELLRNLAISIIFYLHWTMLQGSVSL